MEFHFSSAFVRTFSCDSLKLVDSQPRSKCVRSLRGLGLVMMILVGLASGAAQNPTFTVTTLTDDATATAANCNQTQGGVTPLSNCSLRDALAASATVSGSTPTINFSSSIASDAHPGTYTLGTGGTFLMYTSVNIAGPGPNALTISGGGQFQVFLFDGGTVTVSGLTIANGYGGNGGAILNYTDLTVDNCVLTGNKVSDGGGAISNSGPSLIVSNSMITNNTAQGSGGIDNNSDGSVTLDNSTVSGNTALDAGGITSVGKLTVTHSVFSGNSATIDDGGAINHFGSDWSVDDSYFLGNTAAGRGGAIFTGNMATAISNSVISGNTAPTNHGSGIYNQASTMTLTGDIVPDSIVGSYTGTVSSGPVPAQGLTLQGTAVTVAAGSATGNTSNITLTPSGGLTGAATLTASVQSSPSGATHAPTFSFSSNGTVLVTGTQAAKSVLTINTTSATSAFLPGARRGRPWSAAGGAALAGFLLFSLPSRRRKAWARFVLLVFIGASCWGIAACGGSSNQSGGGGGGSQGTTPGTYSILVTGKLGSTTSTCTVTLTVQ